MPFGPYKDFDACVSSVMSKKKWKKDRASAYCAVIKRQIEGHSLKVSRDVDLSALCNIKLLALHGVLHQWYKRGQAEWTQNDIRKVHKDVELEMIGRKLQHNYKCELDDEKEPEKLSKSQPREVELVYDEFEQELLADLETASLKLEEIKEKEVAVEEPKTEVIEELNTKQEKQIISLEKSIALELSGDFKMPYKFKFAALTEGKFNDVWYPKEELKKGFKSMEGVDLTIDHGKSVKDVVGKVESVWWNEELGRIEGVGRIEDTELGREIAERVHKGLITGVSVEVMVSYSETKNGKTAFDPEFIALSLVKTPACKAEDGCGIIKAQ